MTPSPIPSPIPSPVAEPPVPSPKPVPTPFPDDTAVEVHPEHADAALATVARAWVATRHNSGNGVMATATRRWLKAKGLS